MTPAVLEEMTTANPGVFRPSYRPTGSGVSVDVVQGGAGVVARPRPQTKPQADIWGIVSRHTILGCVVLLATYMTSMVVGNVMLEGARRETIQAQSKMAVAANGEQELKERLRREATPSALHEWALNRNLLAPDELAAASVLKR